MKALGHGQAGARERGCVACVEPELPAGVGDGLP